jgi:hypothetical protein
VVSYHDSKFRYHCLCISIASIPLSPAPPLTLDNIFNVVKNVRSWRTLGQHIYYFSSDLDDIQDGLVSNDDVCLKAVIEEFLSGEGRYEQPSWRALIWSLYKANEIQLAENIKRFSEPVQGNGIFTIDVESVAEFMLAGYGSSSVHSSVYRSVHIYLNAQRT